MKTPPDTKLLELMYNVRVAGRALVKATWQYSEASKNIREALNNGHEANEALNAYITSKPPPTQV